MSSPPKHPFANSTSQIEVIYAESDRIDLEEETRLYEALRQSYNEQEDEELITDIKVRELKTIKRAPPAESIFSADIFLADNSGRPSTTMAFARDVKISGWTTVGDGAGKKKGVGAYVVYDCNITTKEGTTMHILRRYSAFEDLDIALRYSLPKQLLHAMPTLPPKAPLARFRPAFLDSRRKLLEYWLSSILLHPDLGGTQVVRSWVLK